LCANAENLRWAILRGLDETFRKAIARFEQRLDDAIAATRGVVDDALARRRDRSFAVEPEVDRLQRASASLSVVREELAGDRSDDVLRKGPAFFRDAARPLRGSRSAG
jgi:hypothetical protein